jgi:hypothetical protein
MGDGIGWMQPRIYQRGLMVGETPNIDRIGNEDAIFMDYVAMQSCISGRNAFFAGMCPLRTGASLTARYRSVCSIVNRTAIRTEGSSGCSNATARLSRSSISTPTGRRNRDTANAMARVCDW